MLNDGALKPGTCVPNCVGAHPVGDRGETTVMVRNIPMKYDVASLYDEWSLDTCVDFVYVPRTSSGNLNLTFAFINFLSPSGALTFKEKWHHKRLGQWVSKKSLHVSFADVQGLKANLAMLTKKRVRCMKNRLSAPIVFKDGRLVAFRDIPVVFGMPELSHIAHDTFGDVQ